MSIVNSVKVSASSVTEPYAATPVLESHPSVPARICAVVGSVAHVLLTRAYQTTPGSSICSCRSKPSPETWVYPGVELVNVGAVTSAVAKEKVTPELSYSALGTFALTSVAAAWRFLASVVAARGIPCPPSSSATIQTSYSVSLVSFGQAKQSVEPPEQAVVSVVIA